MAEIRERFQAWADTGITGMTISTNQSHAIEVMAAASQTPAAREGVASFLEKRPPVWD